MAVDVAAAVLAVGDALAAVVSVGGAVLLLQAALHAVRVLREAIGAGDVERDPDGFSASDFMPRSESDQVTYRPSTAEEQARWDAISDDFDEDYADEQAFRATLTADQLAVRARDFDEYGSRRGPEKGELMPDGSVHGLPGYRL